MVWDRRFELLSTKYQEFPAPMIILGPYVVWDRRFELLTSRTPCVRATGLRQSQQYLQKMVWVTGLEPATSTSQKSRATNCATPRHPFIISHLFVYWQIIRKWIKIFIIKIRKPVVVSISISHRTNSKFRTAIRIIP